MTIVAAKRGRPPKHTEDMVTKWFDLPASLEERLNWACRPQMPDYPRGRPAVDVVHQILDAVLPKVGEDVPLRLPTAGMPGEARVSMEDLRRLVKELMPKEGGGPGHKRQAGS